MQYKLSFLLASAAVLLLAACGGSAPSVQSTVAEDAARSYKVREIEVIMQIEPYGPGVEENLRTELRDNLFYCTGAGTVPVKATAYITGFESQEASDSLFSGGGSTLRGEVVIQHADTGAELARQPIQAQGGGGGLLGSVAEGDLTKSLPDEFARQTCATAFHQVPLPREDGFEG